MTLSSVFLLNITKGFRSNSMTTNDTTELIKTYLMARWDAHQQQAQHFNIDQPDDRSVDDLMQTSIAGVILQLAVAANGE